MDCRKWQQNLFYTEDRTFLEADYVRITYVFAEKQHFQRKFIIPECIQRSLKWRDMWKSRTATLKRDEVLFNGH